MNYYYPARPAANSIDCVLDFDSKLYIGDAQAFAHYQHYGIQGIISFSTEQQFIAQSDTDQMVLQVNDRPQCDILSYFEKTNQFISKHMNANHNVLVHCVAGKSRSATIILAYLMYSQEWSLQDALTYLKSVRPIISPNPGFIRQLLKYEQQLLGCTKSNLTSDITPYFSVQKPDTIIPQSPADYGTSYRRSSYASPPPIMNQIQYQTMNYGWRYY